MRRTARLGAGVQVLCYRMNEILYMNTKSKLNTSSFLGRHLN